MAVISRTVSNWGVAPGGNGGGLPKAGKHRNWLLPVKPRLDVVLRSQDAATVIVIRRIEYADGTAQQY